MSEQPVNGAAPAPAEAAEGGGAAEKMMGLFGLAVAVGIAVIAIDLLSGGVISRLIGRPQPPEDGSSDG